jgi:hypothetical protein
LTFFKIFECQQGQEEAQERMTISQAAVSNMSKLGTPAYGLWGYSHSEMRLTQQLKYPSTHDQSEYNNGRDR